jgi:protease-4
MVRAIGRFFGWIWSGLDGLRKVLHLILLLMIFAVIGTLFSRPIPLVPDKAALVIAPEGPIVEQLSGDPIERALAESLRRVPSETRLRDIVDAIAAAKDDSRISSLYLDLGGMSGGGVAKLQEIAAALDAFRASGKPVIAYGDFYDQPQYYLAAHADEVYLDPQGIVYVDGFANYGMFVKDALEKLSIDWNVFRVGQYKSAVEMFTRNDMSPAEREESLAWLNSVWGTYKADVAKSREMKPEAIQAYADDAVVALKRANS